MTCILYIIKAPEAKKNAIRLVFFSSAKEAAKVVGARGWTEDRIQNSLKLSRDSSQKRWFQVPSQLWSFTIVWNDDTGKEKQEYTSLREAAEAKSVIAASILNSIHGKVDITQHGEWRFKNDNLMMRALAQALPNTYPPLKILRSPWNEQKNNDTLWMPNPPPLDNTTDQTNLENDPSDKVRDAARKRRQAKNQAKQWWSYSFWILKYRKFQKEVATWPKKYRGLNRITWQGTFVLVIAIAASIWWNHQHGYDSIDPVVKSLMQSMGTHCHSLLTPTRRTQMALGEIEAHEQVLSVPRKWLLWDLDALRDPFIQQELLDARGIGGEPLEADVFLAAHLARLVQNHSGIDPVMQKYLRVLPTHEEYLNQLVHPIFWTRQQLAPLRMTSATHDLIQHYRENMEESYHALVRASPRFGEQITMQEFMAARLNVWTRSFGTGPLTPEQMAPDGHVQELEYLQDRTGIDFSKGCHSMVPILDLYNHHANPNVGFSYDAKQQAFIVKSTRIIPAGQEIFDSYGKHSDAHLLAKYGFVNGDGSDYTQASLALYHPVYSRGMPADIVDKEEGRELAAGRLLRYLQLDDGYAECVDPEADPEAWEFKVLKFQHLRQIAKDPKRWNVFFNPRTLTMPPQKSDEGIYTVDIPEFEPSKVQFDVNPVMSTCRLLVLTHHDYNGTASDLLRENLSDPSFRLPAAVGDALQFRELMCLLRSADMALRSYQIPVEKVRERLQAIEEEKVQNDNLNLPSPHLHRIEWQSLYLMDAEMQALGIVKDLAAQLMHQTFGPEGSALLNSEPAYTMQQTPCPLLHKLLEYIE